MTTTVTNIPENLDNISEQEMLAIAEQLNAIEPGAGITPSAASTLWSFETIETVQILSGLSITLLMFTIFILAIPSIRDLFNVRLLPGETIQSFKTFGDFYRRYFS